MDRRTILGLMFGCAGMVAAKMIGIGRGGEMATNAEVSWKVRILEGVDPDDGHPMAAVYEGEPAYAEWPGPRRAMGVMRRQDPAARHMEATPIRGLIVKNGHIVKDPAYSP